MHRLLFLQPTFLGSLPKLLFLEKVASLLVFGTINSKVVSPSIEMFPTPPPPSLLLMKHMSTKDPPAGALDGEELAPDQADIFVWPSDLVLPQTEPDIDAIEPVLTLGPSGMALSPVAVVQLLTDSGTAILRA